MRIKSAICTVSPHVQSPSSEPRFLLQTTTEESTIHTNYKIHNQQLIRVDLVYAYCQNNVKDSMKSFNDLQLVYKIKTFGNTLIVNLTVYGIKHLCIGSSLGGT